MDDRKKKREKTRVGRWQEKIPTLKSTYKLLKVLIFIVILI